MLKLFILFYQINVSIVILILLVHTDESQGVLSIVMHPYLQLCYTGIFNSSACLAWLIYPHILLFALSHIDVNRRRAKMSSAAARRRKSSASSQHKQEKEEKVATIEYEVPDGGYGWVVVFCAFVFISMPMGVSASFAIYYEEWIEYFHAGKVKTSLVGSVGSGCVPLLGEFPFTRLLLAY